MTGSYREILEIREIGIPNCTFCVLTFERAVGITSKSLKEKFAAIAALPRMLLKTKNRW
jgi:hypothetical protein